jgi:hypothetical protein
VTLLHARTEEPPHLQPHHQPPRRHVGQLPQVPAVRPSRSGATVRTPNICPGSVRRDHHGRVRQGIRAPAISDYHAVKCGSSIGNSQYTQTRHSCAERFLGRNRTCTRRGTPFHDRHTPTKSRNSYYKKPRTLPQPQRTRANLITKSGPDPKIQIQNSPTISACRGRRGGGHAG